MSNYKNFYTLYTFYTAIKTSHFYTLYTTDFFIPR